MKPWNILPPNHQYIQTALCPEVQKAKKETRNKTQGGEKKERFQRWRSTKEKSSNICY